MLVNRSSSARYIESAEESFESAFQVLKITNTTFVGEGILIPKPKLSKAAVMVAKVMIGKGYHAGSGLGNTEQRILTPI